jgi:hypothetical protein
MTAWDNCIGLLTSPFGAQRPQYGIALDSKFGHVPLSLRGEIWMAFRKPALATLMRLAGGCVNGIKNEQILASACICTCDLATSFAAIDIQEDYDRMSDCNRGVAATYDAANVIASARYPSSWTIKATSTPISRPTFWSFGVCANSSTTSTSSHVRDLYSLVPCHALGPRAPRRANHIHARRVGKEEARVITR